MDDLEVLSLRNDKKNQMWEARRAGRREKILNAYSSSESSKSPEGAIGRFTSSNVMSNKSS